MNFRVGQFIRVSSFVAMVMVVLIHANCSFFAQEKVGWNSLFHLLLCQVFTCWAVPFFFTLSGFLFTHGRYVGGMQKIGEFWRGKAMSLGVPYVSWICVAAVLMLPITIYHNYCVQAPLLYRTFLRCGSIWCAINRLMGVTYDAPYYFGVLWYVRFLILIFVFAPVLKFFCKKKLAWMLAVVWLAFQVFGPPIANPYKASRLVLASWFLLGISVAIYLPKRYRPTNVERGGSPCWMRMTFWIYCSHQIFVPYFQSIGFKVLGRSAFATAILTPIVAFVVIVFCICLACSVKLISPDIYRSLNGGRV